MTKWAVWAVVVDGTKLSAEIYSIAFSDKALLAIAAAVAAASDHQLQRLIHLSIYRFHLSVCLCSRVAHLAAPSDTNEHHLNTVMCVYTCVYALARRDARASECVCVSVLSASSCPVAAVCPASNYNTARHMHYAYTRS